MKRVVEFLIEIIGWIQIVISPLLIGLLIGACVYLYWENTLSFFIGILITLLGLIIGVVFAVRVWKKKGTVNFMSRILATPDMDNLKDKENKMDINK